MQFHPTLTLILTILKNYATIRGVSVVQLGDFLFVIFTILIAITPYIVLP